MKSEIGALAAAARPARAEAGEPAPDAGAAAVGLARRGSAGLASALVESVTAPADASAAAAASAQDLLWSGAGVDAGASESFGVIIGMVPVQGSPSSRRRSRRRRSSGCPSFDAAALASLSTESGMVLSPRTRSVVRRGSRFRLLQPAILGGYGLKPDIWAVPRSSDPGFEPAFGPVHQRWDGNGQAGRPCTRRPYGKAVLRWSSGSRRPCASDPRSMRSPASWPAPEMPVGILRGTPPGLGPSGCARSPVGQPGGEPH